jgi:DNA-binding response OmpR family regulator
MLDLNYEGRFAMRVLLVRENVVPFNLQHEGVFVETASDLGTAEARLWAGNFDVVVFDLDMPRANALSRIKRWRREQLRAHLIVVAAKLSLPVRVKLLDAGADCYLLKSDCESELLARIRALARRRDTGNAAILRIFDLEIDMTCRVVRRNGRPISLTPREYALLRFLASHRGQIVSRGMILEHVYGGREESNVINVYIRYLRNKIDRGFSPPLILTRYGKGYMLRTEAEKTPLGTSPITLAG